MIPIAYRSGDATAPEPAQPGEARLIAHVCNNVGAWGAGFVMAISRKWQKPEERYREWYVNGYGAFTSGKFELGAIQIAVVETGLAVANMVAQRGFPTEEQPCALDYVALRSCLETLAERAKRLGTSVHLPRIGCGIAGGSWPVVAAIIEDTLSAKDIRVVVYDLPKSAV